LKIQGDGVQLAADLYAADRPHGLVMLLHGGGQTRHSWRATARRLRDAGWSALLYDARGHGDSDWAVDRDYSIDALTADLRAATREFGVAPVLIGASMGGMTSMVAVGEGQVPAQALVLVDITPRMETAGLARITAFMSAAPEGFATLEEAAESVAAYNPHRRQPATVDGLRRNLRLGDDGRWHWHWDPAFLTIGDEPTRAARFDRLARAAGRIRVPALVVRGEQSDVVSEEGVAELVRTIPGARRVDVPGAGHMLVGDDNDVFTRELLGFLADLSGGTGPRR